MNNNRRTIIKGMAMTPLALAGTELLASDQDVSMKKRIPEKMTILFQGDSITDAGRDRASYYANQVAGMGYGYVGQIAPELLGRHPEIDLRLYNRGVSGDKTDDLLNRWMEDCLHLRPTVLSLLVGVNDFWHTLEGKADMPVTEYKKNLKFLVKRTQAASKNVKIIIGEPFIVKGGVLIDEKWDAFTAYQSAARSVAEELGAVLLEYQTIFDEALEEAPADYWSNDGVHPTMAGAYLMRNAWLKAFYRLFI